MIYMSKSCADCFYTLSEPTRLTLIKELQRASYNVAELTRRAKRTQPTISHHLKLLEELGMVTKEHYGRETRYSFNKNYPCKGCGVFTAPIKL